MDISPHALNEGFKALLLFLLLGLSAHAGKFAPSEYWPYTGREEDQGEPAGFLDAVDNSSIEELHDKCN